MSIPANSSKPLALFANRPSMRRCSSEVPLILRSPGAKPQKPAHSSRWRSNYLCDSFVCLLMSEKLSLLVLTVREEHG
jgi:hypothetical protein